MFLGVLFMEDGYMFLDRIQCHLAGYGIYNAKRMLDGKNLYVSFMCEEPPTNLLQAKVGTLQLLSVSDKDVTRAHSLIRTQGKYYWVDVKGEPMYKYKEVIRSEAKKLGVSLTEEYIDSTALFTERTLLMPDTDKLSKFCNWLIRNVSKKEWHIK